MSKRLDVFKEFKEDHRKIRDMLFDLKGRIEQKDTVAAREILGRLDAFVGPHFRYEEEALYPALRPILEDYVDHLVEAHDGAIATARKLASVVQKEQLSDDDVKVGRRAVLDILPHVSDCDGLAVFMESIQTLHPAELDALAEKIAECRQDALSLLEWADSIRASQQEGC